MKNKGVQKNSPRAGNCFLVHLVQVSGFPNNKAINVGGNMGTEYRKWLGGCRGRSAVCFGALEDRGCKQKEIALTSPRADRGKCIPAFRYT